MYKKEVRDINIKETNKLLETCKSIGINIDYKNFKVDFDKEYGGNVIHKEIKKDIGNKKFFDNDKAWESTSVFYRECMCNYRNVFFVDKSEAYPSIQECVDFIKTAGGLVFVAHPLIYGNNSIEILEMLTQNYEIDGVECYYTSFTKEQRQFLLQHCKENNLYVSGGSDYHGANSPTRKLGIVEGNLNVPDSIIEQWAEI